MNMCENYYYCYMTDTMKLDTPFKPEDYKLCIDKDNCKIAATVRGKCYKDPDACSELLYEDLCDMWGDILGAHEIVIEYNNFRIKSDDKVVKYSSDYIGPSRYWAKAAGVPQELIGEALLICRTIGGHMLWPVHRGSINTARGGSKGYYDRFDLTLYQIKRFYAKDTEPAFTGKNGVFNAVYAESDFFKRFESFEGFVNAWRLNDFVDDNYNVISLVRSDLKNRRVELVESCDKIHPGKDAERYKIYMKNCMIAVEGRTKRLYEDKSLNFRRDR